MDALLVWLASAAGSAVAAVALNQLLITFGSLSEREAVIFVAKIIKPSSGPSASP